MKLINDTTEGGDDGDERKVDSLKVVGVERSTLPSATPFKSYDVSHRAARGALDCGLRCFGE